MEKYQTYLEATLEFISQKGYVTDDNEFFKATSKFLSELFNVDYVLINKYSVKTLKNTETVTIYNRDRFIPNISYDLANTPCENVINKVFCVYPNNVQALFPKDELLAQMNVDSYIGAPLWSSTRQPIGLIALLDSKPLKGLKTIEIILQIVSLKVEKILEKMILENLLELQIQSLLSSKEEIKKKEEKFKKLSNLTFEGIVIHDKGVVIDMNLSLEKMIGYNREELVGKNIIDLLVPKKHQKIISKSIVKNYTRPFEIEVIRKDGSIFPVEIEAREFLTEDNKKLRVAAIRDITQRIETEKSLIKSEERYRDIVENTSEWIWELDETGAITYSNSIVEQILGHKSVDIIGKNNIGLIHKTDKPRIAKIFLDAVKQKKGWKNLELRWIHKDGSYRYLESSAIPLINEEGILQGFRGVNRDITERKKAAEELVTAKEKAERNEEELTKAQELAHIGSWYLDLESNQVVWTKELYKMYGFDPSIPVPPYTEHMKLFTSESWNILSTSLEKTIKTGVPYELELTTVKKDGNKGWIWVRGEALKDSKGKTIALRGIAQDINVRKKAEKELITAKEKAEESDNLKTEFINNMSHEIRTPMNGIIGFSGMLNHNDISDEKRANFIKIIQSSGQQLLNVIDDILEISRLGTKQVKVIESDVCLNDVMLELFSTFDIKAKEHKTPIYLKKALSDKQSTIRTDITKLNKVLSNLLENALKFTNQGFIEFGYQLKNDDIELYVKDTGIGIEKSKHELIFERFSQAEKELSKNVGGLGLGLSIAKENAELLGGSIQLESKEGKGSTFFVTIPYNPVYKVNDTEKSKTVPKYTILIAEDEEINHLYLETLLKDVIGLDCKIIHVTNGKDAIKACKENKTIDLVLMDLKMPVMNGFEATKLIKKLRPNLPIVAQTAYSQLQEKEQAILVGCDDFISKPIHQESFKNILDKYLIIK